MKRFLPIALALVVVAIAAFAAGARWTSRPSGRRESPGASARKILHYTCPMHPGYTSDHAGDCPSCGMRLEPVYEGHADPVAPADAARLVQISAERQQTIGVRIGTVEETSGRQAIRTVGRLVADETRVYPIFAAADGWIQEVTDTSTGSIVKKDQRLGSYYSPELVAALQRYFLSVPAGGDAGPRTYGVASAQTVVQQAVDQLRSLGMTEAQIKDVNRTRAISPEIWILSPAPGFVLARNISSGQRFEKGAELYRIADLTRIWVQADVFGRQADYIKPGTSARIAVPERDRTYQARVSVAQPLFDETTRTLKVRLELDNRDYALKPGMFVDVDFEANLPAAITVPTEAVLDSGLRKTVFVDRGNGYFEPRRVETGWRVGDRVQILTGLMAGERVVISGNFLLDSESRMKSAALGVYSPETDPVCGMEVDREAAKTAGHTAAHKDGTYYFCSDACRKKFEGDPDKYTDGGGRAGEGGKSGRAAPAGMKAEGTMVPTPAVKKAAQATPGKDPVCGMDVDPRDATVAKRTIEHDGKTYFFCSDDCKAKFVANPGAYLKAGGAGR